MARKPHPPYARLVWTNGVLVSGGYRSGRSSLRGTPDSDSTCNTLSAGTRLALTHLFTACGYMPKALANALWPPLARTARSIEDSMRAISTDGKHVSTNGIRILPGGLPELYCLPMIDIRLATDFGDLLDRMLRSRMTSIQQVMEVLECSRAMVDKYRRGKSRPASQKLQNFARRYGYEYVDLLKLVHGRDGEDEQPTFHVPTERAAIVGRAFEGLPDDRVRSAFYELLMSLSRDLRKTGTKD